MWFLVVLLFICKYGFFCCCFLRTESCKCQIWYRLSRCVVVRRIECRCECRATPLELDARHSTRHAIRRSTMWRDARHRDATFDIYRGISWYRRDTPRCDNMTFLCSVVLRHVALPCVVSSVASYFRASYRISLPVSGVTLRSRYKTLNLALTGFRSFAPCGGQTCSY